MCHKQTRRTFLQSTTRAAAGALATAQIARNAHSAANKPPNIIFILADDLGYGDLGCYGQQEIKTPNIDKLAMNGMRFTQHYAGNTVCAPSRCCLMTGKHSGHCEVRGNVESAMKPDAVTLATVLKKAGYKTACIGKWGIGHPIEPHFPKQHGFDHFFGYLSMWHAHNYYTDHLWRNGKKVAVNNKVQHPETHYKPSERLKVGVATERNEYSHDLFVEDALNFIDQNLKAPFFLYLPLTIPHANNEAKDKGMEVPDLGIYQGKDWPEPQKGHAAMISRMDEGVGQIMDRLESLGLDENTLVIFTSDNGPHKEGGADPEFFDSNGPLRGKKRDLYDGGIRVPMIAHWKGKIQPGSTSDHISAFWDYLPTFQEIAGVANALDGDGLSLMPEMLGKEGQQKKHDYLYWEFHEQGGKQAVRMNQWKGARLYQNGEDIELYNVETDIGETNNVAKENPDVVRQIASIMKSAHRNDDAWPLPPPKTQ